MFPAFRFAPCGLRWLRWLQRSPVAIRQMIADGRRKNTRGLAEQIGADFRRERSGEELDHSDLEAGEQAIGKIRFVGRLGSPLLLRGFGEAVAAQQPTDMTEAERGR